MLFIQIIHIEKNFKVVQVFLFELTINNEYKIIQYGY